jgi:ribosomal protein L44E
VEGCKPTRAATNAGSGHSARAGPARGQAQVAALRRKGQGRPGRRERARQVTRTTLRARCSACRPWHRPRWSCLGGTLPADKLAAAGLRELAPVVHEEAA